MTSRSGSTKRRFSRNQTRAGATGSSPPRAGSPLPPPRGRAGHEQGLVDVVVQDRAEALQVLLAQRNAHPLHDRVADGVGMTDALALDDLDLVLRHQLPGDKLATGVAHRRSSYSFQRACSTPSTSPSAPITSSRVRRAGSPPDPAIP